MLNPEQMTDKTTKSEANVKAVKGRRLSEADAKKIDFKKLSVATAEEKLAEISTSSEIEQPKTPEKIEEVQESEKTKPEEKAKAETMELDEEEEEEKEKKNMKVVFQGRNPRSEATWWQRIFFTYAKPLSQAGNEGKLYIEQMGNLDEGLTVTKSLPLLEKNWEYYHAKDPQDEKAMLWAIFMTFGKEYAYFIFMRLVMVLLEMAEPMLVLNFTTFIQSGKETTNDQLKGGLVAMFSLFFLRIFRHLVNENLVYDQIMTGHQSVSVLQSLVYKKHYNLSSATNRDFTTAELHSVISGDVHRIWSFIWSLSDTFQIPLRFIYAAYFLGHYLGWSILSGVVLFAISFTVNYFIGKWRHERWLSQRSVSDKRNQETSEAFSNAKMLKLYGWKDLFLGRIREKREEEQESEDVNASQDVIVSTVQRLLGTFLPTSIYCTFIYNGNHLDLPTKVLTGYLIGQVQHPFHAIQHKIDESRQVFASLKRIHKVVASDEVQKTIIQRVSTQSEYSIEVKGNFSWGIGELISNRKLEDWERDQSEKQAEKTRWCKSLRAKVEQLTETMTDLPCFSRSKKEKSQKLKNDKKKVADLKKFGESRNKKQELKKFVNLQDIDLKIKKGEFVTIFGEIGAGKTTFLQNLIGDMVHVPVNEIESAGGLKSKLTPEEYAQMRSRIFAGQFNPENAPIKLGGNISYVEQQPWLQNGTIRENILMDLAFDETRYVQTLLACQLEDDIKVLPKGDNTLIGERGITLSGGQKARVVMARAAYQNNEIFLLDDPISALDANVRKRIFEQLFTNLLKDKTRVLVTHAVEWMSLADKVVIMKKGKIVAFGTPEELVDHEYIKEITEIHKKHKIESEEVVSGEKEQEKKVVKKTQKKTKVVKTEAVSEDDFKSEGHSSYYSDDSSEEVKTKAVADLSNLTKQEIDNKLDVFAGKGGRKEVCQITKLMEQDDEKVSVSWETYKRAFELAGGVKTVLIVLVFEAITTMTHRFHDFKSIQWSFQDPLEQFENIMPFIKFTFLTTILTMGVSYIRDSYKRKGERALKNKMNDSILGRLLEAPINLFYDITSTGKIMHVIHHDLGVFNGELFHASNRIIGTVMHIISVIGIISLGSTKFWAVIIGFAYVFMQMKKYWHRVDQRLNKVGSSVERPLHTSFSEVLQGNTVIRAFGKSNNFANKQFGMIDQCMIKHSNHLGAWFNFSLQMNFISQLYFLACCTMLITIKSDTDPVIMALIVQYSMDSGWMQHILDLQNWLSHLMKRVQKAFNMEKIPQEKEQGTHEVDTNVWPMAGKIEFKRVQLKYRPQNDIVLKDLSFEIEPAHKVGIVGRTGAGKSTISMALTRIVEAFKGKIEIDGIDIGKIDLSKLRQKITIIPQDPTLFTGSLRFNVDPFNAFSDEKIKELLIEAGLEKLLTRGGKSKKEKKEDKDEKKKKDDSESESESSESEEEEIDPKLKALLEKDESEFTEKELLEKREEEGKGIYLKITEGGSNLSVGEKQLICIVRAILRQNKVVVLDEATANIDVVTEHKIQELMSTHFKHSTVLTIAHRLNTIIQSDRVLVLDKGRKLEYDSPKTLMLDPESAFSSLVRDIKKKEDKQKEEEEEKKAKKEDAADDEKSTGEEE